MTIERIETKARLGVTEAGEIEGLAWLWNEADLTGDVIQKGAINIAVEDMPMLFGHNPEDVIGLWSEVKETPEGLAVKGKLDVTGHDRSKAIRSLMKSGLITGLSIGFFSREAKARPGKGRIITNLDLVEISVVRNPAHPKARVTSAKSASEAIMLADAINRAALALRA